MVKVRIRDDDQSEAMLVMLRRFIKMYSLSLYVAIRYCASVEN